MKRRLFTFASVVSLLLAAATSVLWVRSYFVSDLFKWGPNRWETTTLSTVPGGFHWRGPSGKTSPVDFTVGYWQLLPLTLVIPLWPAIRRCGQHVSRQRASLAKDRTGRIIVDEAGISLVQRPEAGVLWRCRWDEIREIVAWKVNVFAHDVITIGFRVEEEPRYLSANEEQAGWKELLTAVEGRFGINEGWRPKVAFPPLKTNRTVLWGKPWPLPCPVCDYDLRASADRCPECGTPIPQKLTGAR